ncbi:MAG: hypothetical protein M1837_002910 [Sclerophora amabilis]|nr:MAG: hypothetical protein M1837_002910 [Sclerophora amabilis]
MADAAGVAVGTAALFSTCVQCFGYIQLGRNFSKDYDKCLLRLDLVKHRLLRWGRSVGIDADADPVLSSCGLQMAGATEEDVEMVRRLLEQIKGVFDDAEGISRKFESEAGPNELVPLDTTLRRDNYIDKLRANMHDLSMQGRKRPSFAKKAKWAFWGVEQFNTLIADVSGLATALAELFPASKETQRQLCARDLSEIVGPDDEEGLMVLKAASAGVDPFMESTVANVIDKREGHSYLNVRASDDARMANGDQVVAGTQVTGYSHSYEDVSASGRARVQNGNTYGGKSVFD